MGKLSSYTAATNLTAATIPILQGGSNKTAPIAIVDARYWACLAKSAVQLPNTGNTSENTLLTVTLPGGTLGPNGVLRIWSVWSFTDNANNKTFKIKLGGTTFATRVLTSGSVGLQDVRQIFNVNSQSVQKALNSSATLGIGLAASALTTGAIDTSADANIVMTGQCANGADSINLEAYTIDYIRGA